jgi:multiple sugar transport system substrate-binding protein
MHPSSDLPLGPRLSGLHSIQSSGHKTPALNLIKTTKRSHPAKPRFMLSVAATATAAFLSLSTSQAKVDVQFWDMIWGGPEYIDAGKALVAQFNQEHPDINVTYRSIPWANWYQTFVTAIGSGTAPDISTGAGYQAVQLYDQNAILPIDDVISDWKAKGKLDDFFPNTIDILKYDNHYVALPWAIDIRVWYYRKDLLEKANLKPPTNWEEFKADAKALTDSKADQFGMVTAGDTLGMHLLLTLMLNNGGGLFTKDRKLDLTSNPNLEARKFLGDLAQGHFVHPASAGYSNEDAVSAFSQGKGVLFLNNPGITARLSKVADKIGLLPPLIGPHGDKGTIYWVNNIMLYKQGKHPAETKVFLAWWSEHQKDLWTKGHNGQLPARKSFAADPYFQDNPETKFILANYLPVGKTTATHATEIFPKLNDVEGEGALQTLSQSILQGKDVGSSVKAAADRLKSVLED